MDGVPGERGNEQLVRAEEVPWIADDEGGDRGEGAPGIRLISQPGKRQAEGVGECRFTRGEKFREIRRLDPRARQDAYLRLADDAAVVFIQRDVSDGKFGDLPGEG